MNLNEAQSLGKGNKSILYEVEGSLISTPDNLGARGSLEVLYSLGATERYDLGVSGNTNGAVGIYNKFQVIDTQKNDLSAGLDVKINPFNSYETELNPVVYFTRTLGKSKLLINPAIRIAWLDGLQDFVLTPNITFGVQLGELPYRIGYNLGTNTMNEKGLVHSFGLSYNFNR